MNKQILIAAAVAAALMIPAAAALAQESRATKIDAEKMVKKGVDFLKTQGKDKSVSEMTAPSKTFVDKDLYLVIYDLEGKVHAHGQNTKQVGMNLIGFKDPDGKAFVQERVDLAKAKGKFWQDYKFIDPLTKKVLPKQMYCERVETLIVCGGVYKDGA